MAVPRFLHPYARPAREHFITVVRGEGALVFDADGREYVDAMASLFTGQGDRIAAVITEPVQGAGGVRPPVPGYLEGLRRLCDQHGAYLIMDEVICAFGRLGHWFGSEHYGIRPDLITFAKGVTSGYLPVGGVI